MDDGAVVLIYCNDAVLIYCNCPDHAGVGGQRRETTLVGFHFQSESVYSC